MSSSSLIPPSPPPTNPWACQGRVSDYFVIIALALCKNRCRIDYMTEQIHMTYWIPISRIQCWLPRQISFRRDVRETYFFFKNSVKVWHRDSIQIFLCIGLYCFISKIKLTQCHRACLRPYFFLENSLIAFLTPFRAGPWRKDGYLEHLSDSYVTRWQDS